MSRGRGGVVQGGRVGRGQGGGRVGVVGVKG